MNDHDPPTDRSVEEQRDAEAPLISVVVPVYNDPDGVEATLEALTSQTYPDGGHEILVVDNDSTDETPTVVRAYADEHDHVTSLLEDERQSSYAARNTGIEHASGSIFAFVDADMIVEETWLADAVDAFERLDASYMGCDVEMVPAERSESLAQRYNRRTGFPIEEFVAEMGFAPTCCLFVRRSVLEDVGAFDPRLVSGGDREFGHRVRDAGYDQHYTDAVTMYHPTRSTADAILRKARRVGRGVTQLRAFHPDRYGGRIPAVCNPLPYLPPRLQSVRGIEGWASLSRREKVGFYLLSYGRGISNGMGRIEETVRRRVLGG
ncbi:glycosyltransferase [Natronolimnohabitans innermongolicus]|uniref:Glycosyltransferase AglI n=1 Tax=Natronolimnohabitans innermongolicus JCM 12255 TaxID=1227499 RepID=L9XIZ5_9EURY|nr:glycosyltransferase [Natronolimnohabitans innermongolicus]ELY60633.1 glycosyltransferase AglI [Natronolimnohabitans innermongolicus JCM 12255]